MTDEELIEASDAVCLKIIKSYLHDQTAVPDFTSMPARYQLRVLKWFIDTAIEMHPEDVRNHLPELFEQ